MKKCFATEQTRLEKARVLVHCMSGQNRSGFSFFFITYRIGGLLFVDVSIMSIRICCRSWQPTWNGNQQSLILTKLIWWWSIWPPSTKNKKTQISIMCWLSFLVGKLIWMRRQPTWNGHHLLKQEDINIKYVFIAILSWQALLCKWCNTHSVDFRDFDINLLSICNEKYLHGCYICQEVTGLWSWWSEVYMLQVSCCSHCLSDAV